MIKESLCNTALLKLPKTAFLSSRQVPASVVMRNYDRAIDQREKGQFQATLKKKRSFRSVRPEMLSPAMLNAKV